MVNNDNDNDKASPDAQTTTTKTKPPKSETPPPLPSNWTRCHEYMVRKRRYCRQQVVKGTNYCGNHSSKKTRIPCPLDPSHDVDASQLEKHLLVCPFRKRMQQQQEQYYYSQGINCGGHGTTVGGYCRGVVVVVEDETESWARRLALQVIRVHQQIFTGKTLLADEDLRHVSFEDIVSAIPTLDLAREEASRLRQSVQHYRIKSGGERHLVQQASLVGHLRRVGVLDHNDSDNSTNHGNRCLTIVEMGAGRGMFGLVAAGVAAKQSHVKLIMVERSGSRSKADGVLRMAKDETDYMALNRVEFSRISCDLANVNVASVLSREYVYERDQGGDSSTAGGKRKHADAVTKSKIIVIAKHLCGVGTDLALKSLRNVSVDIHACVFATCCHGICCFDNYVGRDFFRSHFGDSFGLREFNLLRRWASGTVVLSPTKRNDERARQGHGGNDEHTRSPCHIDDNEKDPQNASTIVESLGLESLGPQGLGRVCQRLLDQGRLEYVRDVLFQGEDACVEMMHYVPSEVTPQNAVLVAYTRK